MRVVGLRAVELQRLRPLFVREVDEEALDELAKSMEAVGGALEPIIARPSKELKGQYDLICGYRRCLAARKLGMTVLTCLEVECDDLEAYQLFLTENLQREGLSDYEVAKRLKEMKERFGLTSYQIAELLGKSQPWVERHLKMLELEKDVEEALRGRTMPRGIVPSKVMEGMTEYQARAILEQPEPVRKRLVEEVVKRVAEGEEVPSARSLERMARELSKEEARVEEKPEAEPKVVVERTLVARPEDVDRFFEKLLGAKPSEEAPTAPAPSPTAPPTPSAEDAIRAVNDLLSQLREVVGELCRVAADLKGARVRLACDGEQFVGVVASADRRALFVEAELSGGAKAERMVRWYELERVEAA